MFLSISCKLDPWMDERVSEWKSGPCMQPAHHRCDYPEKKKLPLYLGIWSMLKSNAPSPSVPRVPPSCSSSHSLSTSGTTSLMAAVEDTQTYTHTYMFAHMQPLLCPTLPSSPRSHVLLTSLLPSSLWMPLPGAILLLTSILPPPLCLPASPLTWMSSTSSHTHTHAHTLILTGWHVTDTQIN